MVPISSLVVILFPHQSSDISIETLKDLIPRESVAHRLYGFPKIHKIDILLRPKVRSPSSNSAKYQEYLSQEILFYSTHFVQLIFNIILDHADCLVGSDVTSLFTKNPVNVFMTILFVNFYQKMVIQVFWQILQENALFQRIFSSQANTSNKILAPLWMGSPLSPLIAKSSMEAFVKEALESADLKPKLYFRYVDGAFIILPRGPNTVSSFLVHLNN